MESVKTLNIRLKQYYGTDIASGQQMWRILFSEDERAYEWRHGEYVDHSEAGIYLRTVTETRYVRKYEWVFGKYILEHLVAVPEVNFTDLPTMKTSYELLHVFEDKDGNPLAPIWEACQFLIDIVHLAMGRKRDGLPAIKKIVDPEGTTEGAMLAKRKRIDEYTNALFGEQSGLGGSTKTGETIIVPNNFERT